MGKRTGAGCSAGPNPATVAAMKVVPLLLAPLAVVLVGCSESSRSVEESSPPARTPAEVRSTVTGPVPGPPPPWTVVLDDLALGSSGIGFALHPTDHPVSIAVDSDAAILLCPADAVGRPADPGLSWGGRWTTCEAIASEPIELPETDGRSHVGIRIRTADRAPRQIRELRIWWDCADGHFEVRDPRGQVSASAPNCASADAGGARTAANGSGQ